MATTVDEVRQLGAIPVWSPHGPCAADLLGVGRSTAAAMARRGELPTIRVGRKGVRVPVQPLLRMLGADSGGDAHVSADAETG